MTTSKTRDVAAGQIYISLDASEAILLTVLLHHMAEISTKNDAPAHAKFCERLANGIEAARLSEL